MRKWGVSTPAPVRHLVKIRQLSVTIRHLHRMMSLGNNSYGREHSHNVTGDTIVMASIDSRSFFDPDKTLPTYRPFRFLITIDILERNTQLQQNQLSMVQWCHKVHSY